MDDQRTITLHPRDVLRQLARAMNQEQNELTVTLPVKTTWRDAVHAVQATLGDVDKRLVLLPPGTGNRRALREMALRAAQESSQPSSENVLGRPIRTSVDLGTVQPRPPRSEAARERLRQMAKKAANEEFRQPYVSLKAELYEAYLPTVRAEVVLKAVDCEDTDPSHVLEDVKMIFDTGAHCTIITEELLPRSFREYLKDPVHDPYRSSSGLSLQMEASIALTNSPIAIDAIATVVPKVQMPNQLVGILFGQSSCIDRLTLRMIPRPILLAKGEDISEEFWGDIIVEEYVNVDNEIVPL